MQIPYRERTDLFDQYHGELLIQILEGTATIRTAESKQQMEAGDQVLLVDGEPFNLNPTNTIEEILAQFIWMPGLNPCKTCWENYGRFYNKENST